MPVGAEECIGLGRTPATLLIRYDRSTLGKHLLYDSPRLHDPVLTSE